MKHFYSLFFLLLLAGQAIAQSLFVGSYNIRYHNSGDDQNGNVWSTRCKVICDQLNFEDLDIFGAQEVLDEQLNDLLRQLDNYAYIGVGRDDGKKAGEYAAIFYKKDRITLLRDGHFWLSETPNKPGLGWDAACVRICTWGEFEQKTTGLRFFFFNLHMDHVGTIARREAARLVVKRIGEMAQGKPVVLTGDFNVDQNDEIYSIFTSSSLLADSYECARFRFAENGTFNSFNPDLKTDSRIDHVFVSPAFTVDRYAVLTNCYWTDSPDAVAQRGNDAPSEVSLTPHVRRLPSDHYPVLVKLHFLMNNE